MTKLFHFARHIEKMISGLDDKMLSGICPDDHCGAKLYFMHYDASIECSGCSQRFERSRIKNIEDIPDPEAIIHSLIRNILLSRQVTPPKKGAEMVLVSGLSNYHCKLLSPFLTTYGMDKKTGLPKPLSTMNQGDTFDCGVLHDRSFLIDPEHLHIVGYGFDVSGSMNYLGDTLEHIRMFNDLENRLIPIHADGDGHCLVHAVSRALVGRELFWHPLRCNLKKHFEQNLPRYKELFKEFVDDREWSAIIDECDPKFIPPDGELLGLRNIHIFGLANILKRPIILLDSIKGMQSSGDYSALFLPALVEPSSCKDKEGVLNKPLCIAWSSSGRNHYIPLVGIKKASLPKLHRSLVPKAWGTSQSLVDQYIEFDDKECCTIGGDRMLGDVYILRLTAAMDKVFMEENGVHPSLVADVHHYVYRRVGVVGIQPQQVVKATQRALMEKRLYRCLRCNTVCEQQHTPSLFKRNGGLYRLAVSNHGNLMPNKLYSFPTHGVACTYDPVKDELVPDYERSQMDKCSSCNWPKLRLINRDGTVVYLNGDQTKTPSESGLCGCGWKHFWNGKEYDNIPKEFKISLEWKGKEIIEIVTWFAFESDPTLNSNAYDIALDLVQKNFPGEFGTESLVKSVVDKILEQTKLPELPVFQKCLPKTKEGVATPPMKLVASGPKLLHKEELGASNFERQLLKKVAIVAPQQQKRQTVEAAENYDSMRPKNKKPSPSLKTKNPDIKVEPLIASTTKPISPQRKLIRVVTSDGRQGSFHLANTPPTYSELQDWIEKEFDIPCSRQNLKAGVPPKEFYPENERELDTKPLNLAHGDRVLVEIAKDPTEELVVSLYKTISSPISHEEQALLLASLIYNQTTWEYSQNHSSMFVKKGYFYREAQKVGLQDNKHYRFTHLPDKVFRYNKEKDCLEVCLEPHGHFEISPGIEEEVVSRVGGSLGVLIPCDTKNRLGSSDKAEAARSNRRSILKNTSSNVTRTPEPAFIRKGPGFSVVNPVINNEANSIAEQLHNLVADIAQQSMEAMRATNEASELLSDGDNNDDNSKSSVMDTNT